MSKKATNPRLLLSKEDTWVRPYFRKYRKLLILVLFLGLLTFFAGSALMFTSGFLISKSASRPWNVLAVYVPIVLTRAFGIGRPLFRYMERLGSHDWVLRMTSDIRLKLYRSLESRAAKSKEEFQTGSILGILAEDIEHIQNLYLRTIFPTLIGLLLYVLIVIGFGVFSLPFALLILVMLGVIVIILPLASVAVNQARVYRRKQERHTLYNQLTDSILGVGDWQYSGRYEEFLARYNDAEKNVRAEDVKLNKYTRFQDFMIQLVFGLIIVAIFIWAGTYFGSGPKGSLNWVAAFVLAVFPLMDAFSPISQGVTELPMYEDSAQRLDSLPVAEPAAAVDETVVVDEPLVNAEIDFENITFSYQETGKVIFQAFNLHVVAGQTLAILGKSGIGKTTLSKILRGDLSPQAGRVLINGQPVASLGEMSRYIGVLNQSPHLFNTSILNNVRLGNLEATDEEVLAAIYQAGLQSVIDKLPEGVNTLVEEGGKRFSGGEQQRIALARILLQDAPIVIIDEPTIGLDPLTERALLETVLSVLKDKTVLWITHHLMSIEQADRVIFIQTGEIIMDDTPQELKETNLHYQYLLSLDYN
ncbi:thiol reductant ABC exporter subunit CydC [Vagococcus sp. BWB3-3]|uniref:Thiol reductant ABC exporter subunit CydC n=1 Tax=Vagococcus allomyrinae TaxID=2794353 RepID=A0A940PAD9_9ENTE|nr:thiol reductant ABC exporter subunit CydC [Vagococcus allomyrinae]MBP1043970.1 thiol reductant ABC exporter subunit CydC [Vagococcus allomyrinae]